MDLNEVLRDARMRAGYTLTDAAGRLGIGKATLSRLETAKGPVTSSRLTQLARLYGVRPADLLDGTITSVPSGETELQQTALVVEEVERIIADANPRPGPQKVSSAVVEILKLARADQATKGGDFDVRRYIGLARAILR